MNAAGPLRTSIAAAWPPPLWQDLPVLVGVSGGADSTALLLALVQLRPRQARGQLVAAHFDHGLRAESAKDAEFAAEVAGRLGLPLAVERARGLPRGEGLEQAARRARYEFFRRAAEQHGCRYLATAHTADDQAETVLHRIVRGTGLRGLAGIPLLRPLSPWTTIVRPMLHATREQVEQFLRERGQAWREDASNRQLRQTRNRIRHELLPLLERDFNPQVRAALVRLARHAADSQRAVERAAESLLDAAAGRIDADACDLECWQLTAADDLVALEALRIAWRRAGWPEQSMDRASWRRLHAAAGDPSHPPLELPGAVRVVREGSWLRLMKKNDGQQ